MERPLPDSGQMISPEADTQAPPMKWSTALTIGAIITLVGSLLVALLCGAAFFLMRSAMDLGATMLNDMNFVGIMNVVDDYMTAMYYGDAERAYRYYSDEARGEISQAELEAWLADDRYDYSQYYDIADFGDLQQLSQTTNPNATTVEQALEGMRYRTGGTLYYRDGGVRDFDAIIIYEGGTWRIESLEIED
jgi:hypothetical protein